MKNLVVPTLLTLWLILSLSFWLIGIGFAGGWIMPDLNLFTLLVLYAPWAVISCFAASAWWSSNKKVSD